MQKQYDISNSIYFLGRMLHYSTHWSQKILLKYELEHLENYIKLQKIILGDRLNVFVNVGAETQNCFVIKLILQPLVENSIVHGMIGKNNLNIDVKISIENQLLLIEIFDDGVGISADELKLIQSSMQENNCFYGEIKPDSLRIRMSGIGLNNINERIRLTYGHEYGIIIESEKNVYTKVTAVLPVEKTIEGMRET